MTDFKEHDPCHIQSSSPFTICPITVAGKMSAPKETHTEVPVRPIQYCDILVEIFRHRELSVLWKNTKQHLLGLNQQPTGLKASDLPTETFECACICLLFACRHKCNKVKVTFYCHFVVGFKIRYRLQYN